MRDRWEQISIKAITTTKKAQCCWQWGTSSLKRHLPPLSTLRSQCAALFFIATVTVHSSYGVNLGSPFTVMKFKSVSVIHQLWQSIFRPKHLCLAVIPLSIHSPLYPLQISPYGDNTLLMNTTYKTDSALPCTETCRRQHNTECTAS